MEHDCQVQRVRRPQEDSLWGSHLNPARVPHRTGSPAHLQLRQRRQGGLLGHHAHVVAERLADEVGQQRRAVRLGAQPRQLLPHQRLRGPGWRAVMLRGGEVDGGGSAVR